MKKIINLLFGTVNYNCSKFILAAIEQKKIKPLLLRLYLICLAVFTLILLPLLFSRSLINFAVSILVLSMVFGAFALFFLVRKHTISAEKLDRTVMSFSIYNSDFINFLKNDIRFNLKFGFLIGTTLFILQFVIMGFFFIFGQYSALRFFILSGTMFVGLNLITTALLYYFHWKYKDSGEAFARVDRKEGIDNKLILWPIIAAVVFFPVILIVSLILSSFLKAIIPALLITIVLTIISYVVIIKFNLYNKAYLKYFLNKTKEGVLRKRNLVIARNIIVRLLSPKLLFPTGALVLSIVFFYILHSFLGITYSSSYRLFCIFSAVMFSLFPVFNDFMAKRFHIHIEKPFTFTVLVFGLMLFFILISPIILNSNITEDSSLYLIKSFVVPFINTINMIVDYVNYFCGNILQGYYVFFTPFIFVLILGATVLFNQIFHYFARIADLHLRKQLTKKNPSILFGDSLSLYPFVFGLTWNIILISILAIELKPIAMLLNDLFTTFQVVEVFKFTFLTLEHITSFFDLLLKVFIGFVCLKLLHLLISSLLSHFILFNDEIVYYENKIFKKTVLRIPLSRVNYVIIKQNFLEKLFDIGTVYIETVDKNGMIKISGVPSIKEKNILIMDKIKSDL